MEIVAFQLHASKRESLQLKLVIALAGLFFLASSFLVLAGPLKFDSPDESANYQTIVHYIRTGQYTIPEPLMETSTIVAPRSFGIRSGELLPGSFMGMVMLYGWLAKAVGIGIVPFLTPFFASVAIIFFYLLIKKIFSLETAWLATILLVIHPAWWYWSSRGLFHNVLFIATLVVGFYLLAHVLINNDQVDTTPRHGMWMYGLAGFMIGAAVAIRTSEVFWVFLILAVVFLAARKRFFRGIRPWLFLLGLIIPLIPILYFNNQFYGQPLSFAYARSTIEVSSSTTVALGLIGKVANAIFPFTIEPRLIVANFWNYGLGVFWWLSLPTLLGLLLFRSNQIPLQRLYYRLYIVLVLWLAILYGSLVVHDTPDPTKITFGTSYTRYLLPLYVFGLPFAGLFLRSLMRYVRHQRRTFGLIVSLSIVYLSVRMVVFDKDVGLVVIRQHAVEYQRLATRVSQQTPDNAVIISGRSDKALYPERRVIVAVESNAQLAGLRRVLNRVPIYVYVSPVESPLLMERTWKNRGFRLIKPIQLSKQERLYLLEDQPK